jgi:hypothetical protein
MKLVLRKAVAFARQSNNCAAAWECNVTEKMVKDRRKNKDLLKVCPRINVPIAGALLIGQTLRNMQQTWSMKIVKMGIF